MAALTAAGPVLVHFFDPAQLNSVRALPYITEWNRRYLPLGLTTLGIHSPRFGFTADATLATEAIGRIGIDHPVALDLDYAIWHDYGCKGWPALFLWGRGGALVWAHNGEGEYLETEEAIQESLRADDVAVGLPRPMNALRATDRPGVLLPVPSAEVFPGGSAAKPWEPGPEGSPLELAYEAGEAWAVTDGEGELSVSVDNGAGAPISVPPAGLSKLAGNGSHEAHSVRLEVSPGVRIWAISFAPGTP